MLILHADFIMTIVDKVNDVTHGPFGLNFYCTIIIVGKNYWYSNFKLNF